MFDPNRLAIVVVILLGISLAISYTIGLAVEEERLIDDHTP